MPRFSAFWLSHYKEIGNCCMTAPLKKLIARNNLKVKVPDKFQSLQLVIDYIDTGWMDQKQLKWIGWDIQGWYAWTDPNGMLYRIKDLQRNEDGREYEKEVEEIVASGDPRTHQGTPTAKELYTFERDMQRNCGFCPDGSSGGGSDADHEGDKGNVTKKENIADDIDLDKLMQGNFIDLMPGIDDYLPKAPITDTTEVTETGHITDNPYVPSLGGADDGSGIEKDIIDDLPILPPTPMPVPANRQNPVLNTIKVTDSSKVATPVVNHFQQKMAERQRAFEVSAGWGFSGSNLENEDLILRQKNLAEYIKNKEEEKLKKALGKDANIKIRFVFEGARDKDGNHNDEVIEKEIQKGNPNKKIDVYVVYIKGLTQNGGIAAGGSIERHWETEPNISNIKIDPIEILPPRNMNRNVQLNEPKTKITKISFVANTPNLSDNPLNDNTLQEVANMLNSNPNNVVVISVNGAFPSPPNINDRAFNSTYRNTSNARIGGLTINQLLNLRVNEIIQKLIISFKVNPRQLFNISQTGNPFTNNTQTTFRYSE